MKNVEGTFKNEYSFEKRQSESLRIREKYPDRIPIIVQMSKSADLPSLDKHKYLVPQDLTIGQFVYVIRKRIKLKPEKALYVYLNNTLPATASLILNAYEQHKDLDGFLYFSVSGESTFGMDSSMRIQ
jgi:GABA(A) receptor-associated protein